MERLTTKVPNDEHYRTLDTKFIQSKEIDKLGQLEDVEQELGIDLITLFKVIKGQKIYVKKFDKYLQCDFGVRNYGRDYVFIHRHGVVNTRCYKKTWSLRKEDFE